MEYGIYIFFVVFVKIKVVGAEDFAVAEYNFFFFVKKYLKIDCKNTKEISHTIRQINLTPHKTEKVHDKHNIKEWPQLFLLYSLGYQERYFYVSVNLQICYI